MKAVQLLVNSLLPPDLRDPAIGLDAGSIEKKLVEVAQKYPDRFERISKDISDVGRNAAFEEGSSIRLSDLRPPMDVAKIYKEMDAELAALKKLKLEPADLKREKLRIWQGYSDKIEKTMMEEGGKTGNALVNAVASGARGKPAQIRSMLAGAGLFTDARGEPIPYYVRRSYGQGVRPADMLAGSYGARTSVISTKTATAKGGDWSKLAVQSTADQIVTEKDCGTQNGIDLTLGETNLQGRILARGVPGLDAGTVLDKQGVGLLWRAKPEKVIVRSPLTCQATAGVCAKCVGLRKGGRLPEIGDAIGVTAATALGEPITQSALNTKHTAGQASGKREYSGFNWISQFTQAPDDFPDKAALATEDGSVEDIRDAPQGGKYIRVNGKEHFVLPGFAETVKVGDVVEKGDQLSEGLVNPSEMVDLRGLGEGRRFYADRLKKMLDDSGMKADPVNVELVTRGLLRHVRMDDPDEWSEYLPDDIVDYEKFRQSYSPPEDTHPNDPESAIGLYLQQPTLHYTIGTRITPKVAARIKGAGFSKVQVSQAQPWFRAEMPRMRTASHVNDDWLASMHTSYLKGQLGSSAVRGADTNIASNVHFAPRLAQGAGFGEDIRRTGTF